MIHCDCCGECKPKGRVIQGARRAMRILICSDCEPRLTLDGLARIIYRLFIR